MTDITIGEISMMMRMVLMVVVMMMMMMMGKIFISNCKLSLGIKKIVID